MRHPLGVRVRVWDVLCGVSILRECVSMLREYASAASASYALQESAVRHPLGVRVRAWDILCGVGNACRC